MSNKISDLDWEWISREWDSRLNVDAENKNATYFDNVDTDIWELEKKRDFNFIESYISKESIVLDFGCGIGKMAEILHDKISMYVGADVSGEAIKKAIARCDKDNCKFFINKSSDLTLFDDETFDLVFSIITFQHILKDVVLYSYLPELLRVLKSGGRFVFQFVNRLSYHSAERLTEINKAFLEKSGASICGGTISSYTKEELQELFKKFLYKFEIIEFTGQATEFEKLNKRHIIWHIVRGMKI